MLQFIKVFQALVAWLGLGRALQVIGWAREILRKLGK